MNIHDKVAPNINSNDILEQARYADLVSYLIVRGVPLKKEGRSYRIFGYGGLIVTDYRWYWHSRGRGGKAIDFLMEFFGMTFHEAVRELTGFCIQRNDFLLERKEVVRDRLPDRASSEKRVIAYLCKTRGIEFNTVINLIRADKLYQDINGNCVFVINDRNGLSVGAELHGTVTGRRYKRSTKYTGFGFQVLCGSQYAGAMFFESAVDLLSYYQLFRSQLTHHYLISLAGVSHDGVIQVFHQHNPELKICLCCDNDAAGDNLIQRVESQIGQVFVHRPPVEYKDWNEYLLSSLRSADWF